MGRFLLGVVFALAIWFGYRTWFTTAENDDAVASPGAVATGGAFLDGAGPASGSPELRRGAGAGGGAPSPAVAEAAAGGAAAAQPATFERFGSTALERVRRAGSIGELLELLGPDNRFLHTDEGRQATRVAIQRIDALAPDEAGAAATRLFELCATGDIERAELDVHAVVDEVRDLVRAVARRTVFDPARLDGAKAYRVRPNDTLIGIAARHRRELQIPLEFGTLRIVNRITNPQALHPDQQIKIPMQPIHTVVWKRSFLVAVYFGDVIGATYWCAHGRPEADTPETRFVVGKKVEEPDWHTPGRVIPYGHPDNPLGTHFVEFRHESYTSYGIHGTWDPDSIGTRASAGCVRLSNSDIAEFAELVPSGTTVDIRR
ncbi:MAG: L,D-transpeptidase family protein [Planctomycetes bacterium]|nr:L,D-transpeptidase family protein [Planctomycetota bacterium]